MWCAVERPARGAYGLAGVVAPAAQCSTAGDRGDRESQMQPVVGIVDRHEIGRTVVIYDKAVDEEH